MMATAGAAVAGSSIVLVLVVFGIVLLPMRIFRESAVSLDPERVITDALCDRSDVLCGAPISVAV